MGATLAEVRDEVAPQLLKLYSDSIGERLYFWSGAIDIRQV